MAADSLRTLLEFSVELAWQAGKRTLPYFQANTPVERKEDDSPVTAADRAAEEHIRQTLQRQFPGDGIVGEEFGIERPDARRRWITDPIDGTKSFVRGVPLYGVLLALEEAGEVLLGVLHFPALDETVYAARGEGCFWNGRRARVSTTGTLNRALVLTSDAEDFDNAGLQAGWDALRGQAQEVRTWGDAYGYALVATGRAEAMLDARFSIWDAAAVLPVIEEAGGVFTDAQGRRSHETGSGIATNATLATAVRSCFGIDAPQHDAARGVTREA